MKLTDNKRHRYFGFTLIELLVVASVTAMIAMISIANFRAGEKRKRVALAIDNIVSAIGLAQTYTLAGKQIANSTCSSGSAPQAYLVNFSVAQTINIWGLDNCNVSNLVETIYYPTNVRVQTNGYKLEGLPVSVLKVKFATPFAKLTISTTTGAPEAGPFNSFGIATIILESSDGSVSKTATIDGIAGRITQ